MRPFLKYWVPALAMAIMIATGIVVIELFPAERLLELSSGDRLTGAAVFALVMCFATVIAPITVLPLVPLLAPILGPFVTAVASIVGWTLGAVIAFLIARYGGRPLAARFVPLRTLEAYEARLPNSSHLIILIMLRVIVPVDVLSYALGIVSSVSLLKYTLTTAIGVSWFSFTLAYSGKAFTSGNYVLLGGISVASVIIVLFALWYIRGKASTN